MKKHAILVTTSTSAKLALRKSGLQNKWSRLYQAGDFYLDLSLQNDGIQEVLIGQIVSSNKRESAPSVDAFDIQHKKLESTVDPQGQFRVIQDLQPIHRLEFMLEGEDYNVIL